MKQFKKGIITLCLLCLHQFALAQGFMKGDIIVSASVGVPHLNKVLMTLNTRTDAFKNGFRGEVKVSSVKGTNPLLFKYEYGISQYFGIGFSVGFWSVRLKLADAYSEVENPNTRFQTTRNYVDTYNYRFSSTSFGIRPNVHIPLQNKKADFFIGCAFGVTKNTIGVDFSSSSAGRDPFISAYFEKGYKAVVYLAPTIGYRRYLTANLGLNLEAGFEKGALLQAGLVFRFRPIKYEPMK